MNRKFKISMLIISTLLTATITILTPIIVSSSSQKNDLDQIDQMDQMDQKLKTQFNSWYSNLSNDDWNKDEQGNFIDYKSNSEQQSLCLYANYRGYYWNEALHRGEEPIDQVVRLKLAGEDKPLKVFGNDYKYIIDALSKSIWPYEYTTYHGVEYMENEFYDQLKNYIIGNDKDGYDYSKCIGQTITSYGLLSTSISRKEAIEYCDGWNWENDTINLPLKEKFVFEITIPKGISGAAYLADFPLSGIPNQDNQILFSTNASMLITDWYTEGDVNFFKLNLINIGH